MGRKTKAWLVIAASLVVIGLILVAVAMFAYAWDFTELSTEKYETNTHTINETFRNIAMYTDTADIRFVLSDGGACTVECYEEEKDGHLVFVQEDTLVIKAEDEKEWDDYVGIHFGTPKITVYLPKADYTALSIEESTGDIEIPGEFRFENADIALSTGDVQFCASVSGLAKIKTTTGNIQVESISAGTLDLCVSTGRITASNVACEGDVCVCVSTGKTALNDLSCKNLTSSGSTGDIALKCVIVTEKMTISRSTGDVKFEGTDAGEIFIETDTGDVTGSLLTEKVVIAQTNTGSVDVPQSVAGGSCEIFTNTGDISVTIQQ